MLAFGRQHHRIHPIPFTILLGAIVAKTPPISITLTTHKTENRMATAFLANRPRPPNSARSGNVFAGPPPATLKHSAAMPINFVRRFRAPHRKYNTIGQLLLYTSLSPNMMRRKPAPAPPQDCTISTDIQPLVMLFCFVIFLSVPRIRASA